MLKRGGGAKSFHSLKVLVGLEGGTLVFPILPPFPIIIDRWLNVNLIELSIFSYFMRNMATDPPSISPHDTLAPYSDYFIIVAGVIALSGNYFLLTGIPTGLSVE